ncbi:MAG: hypothetical protein AAF844_12640 [Pseudomonadota bacterium]
MRLPVAFLALGIAGVIGTAGQPAFADWAVQDGNALLPGIPTAAAASGDGDMNFGVVCLSGKTPIFVIDTGRADGPPSGDVTLAVDGRAEVVEARREDDLWIGSASPRLISALARGIRLAVLPPGETETIISLRGSARAIGEALTGCG